MLIALDPGSAGAWDIEFPSIKRVFSIQENDACKIRPNNSLIVVFWWNLLPDGEFDERFVPLQPN
jgi:hypothetical protein